MGRDSKIEWTDHTINPWWGCAKVHKGCTNCYAEYLSDKRYNNGLWGEKKKRRRIKSAFPTLNQIQRWAAEDERMTRVFIGSMMDIFEVSKELTNPVDDLHTTGDLRMHLFDQINEGLYPNVIFLFLTKRPENIVHMIPYAWINDTPKNVWYGTSISDQETVKWAESLRLVSNTNLFLSVEPQVGPIEHIDLDGIDWVIQGGESGSKKRPFNLEWAYWMKEQCKLQDTPYFFKQIDKVQQIPEDLLVDEFPEFVQLNQLQS